MLLIVKNRTSYQSTKVENPRLDSSQTGLNSNSNVYLVPKYNFIYLSSQIPPRSQFFANKSKISERCKSSQPLTKTVTKKSSQLHHVNLVFICFNLAWGRENEN